MSKKKICFIAQFPPPVHGLSKAVDTLYNSRLADEFEFEKVNITDNKNIINNLILISRSKADLFYFTISQTKVGNLRDLMILKLLDMQKKKCLIHLHGGYYRQLVDYDMSSRQRKANYKAVSRLAGAVVLGESLKSIFQGMLPESRIYTVANCVDDEYLMSDEEFGEKTAMLAQRAVKHILYLSNFIKSKGYPEVLEMAKLEKQRVESGSERKFHFDFAGGFFEKAEEDYFRNYIKENSLEDYVTFYGIVQGESKRALLKKCDIFVLLTRYTNEGQPISILEAMGNGMVILTTNHAGIPDIVKDGVNGILVDKNSIDVSSCLSRLLSINNDIYCSIEKCNRNICKAYYSQNRYLDDMLNVYKIC